MSQSNFSCLYQKLRYIFVGMSFLQKSSRIFFEKNTTFINVGPTIMTMFAIYTCTMYYKASLGISIKVLKTEK